MNSEPSPLVLTNQDKRLEMSGFVLTQTLRPSGTSGTCRYWRADAKSLSHGKWGSTGWQALKCSNQEQMP